LQHCPGGIVEQTIHCHVLDIGAATQADLARCFNVNQSAVCG
jgi:hypothetical protein